MIYTIIDPNLTLLVLKIMLCSALELGKLKNKYTCRMRFPEYFFLESFKTHKTQNVADKTTDQKRSD